MKCFPLDKRVTLEDAQRVLSEGEIVVIIWDDNNEAVMRANVVPAKYMWPYIKNGWMRYATTQEKEYWFDGYNGYDAHGRTLDGMQEWLENKGQLQ